jgi:putative sterol carrier protein
MTASIVLFLDDLGRRGHEPLLGRVSATARFDITDGDRTEHRLVRIDRGDIRVSTGDGPSDCAMSGDRAIFDAILAGRTSMLAALLRGALTIEGDPELLVLTQRLFRCPGTGDSGPDGHGDDGGAGRLS